MLTISVCHWNNTNFYKLLEVFPDAQVNIYDKSQKAPCMNERFKYIPIENAGREAATYLLHIIQNYDSLSDYTLFVQDDTDNHIMNYQTLQENVYAHIRSGGDFYSHPCKWRVDDTEITQRTIQGGYYNFGGDNPKDLIVRACTRFGIYIPDVYVTDVSAFFCVSRRAIRRRPLQFYVDMRNWVLEENVNEFILEHVWTLLFQDRFPPKPVWGFYRGRFMNKTNL